MIPRQAIAAQKAEIPHRDQFVDRLLLDGLSETRRDDQKDEARRGAKPKESGE
jgi:hypothetical protein